MYALRKQRTHLGAGRHRRVWVLERTRRARRVPPGRSRQRASSSSAAICRAQPRIPAMVANRVETPRRTTLSLGRAAAWKWSSTSWRRLAGLRIDNCEIWVNEAEMPGCDGSSQPFVALARVGRHRRARSRAAGARGAQRRRDWATTTVGSRPGRARPAACRSSSGWITAAATPSAARRCNWRSRPTRFAASWPPAARSCSKKKPNG